MRHLCFLGGLAAFSACWATPIVKVGNNQPTTWTSAMNNGNVVPTTGAFTTTSNTFYNGLASGLGLGGAQQQVPVLTPDVNVSDGSVSRTALVTSWGQPNPNTLGVAGWEFGYNGDPDLNGLIVDFEAFAPVGTVAIGFELVDMNGLAKSWYRRMPLDHWDPSYVFNPAGGLQTPFTDQLTDPGFNLATVLVLRFTSAAPFGTVSVPPDPTGRGELWSAWAHIVVAPEPGTWVAVGIGALALLRRRKN